MSDMQIQDLLCQFECVRLTQPQVKDIGLMNAHIGHIQGLLIDINSPLARLVAREISQFRSECLSVHQSGVLESSIPHHLTLDALLYLVEFAWEECVSGQSQEAQERFRRSEASLYNALSPL